MAPRASHTSTLWTPLPKGRLRRLVSLSRDFLNWMLGFLSNEGLAMLVTGSHRSGVWLDTPLRRKYRLHWVTPR